MKQIKRSLAIIGTVLGLNFIAIYIQTDFLRMVLAKVTFHPCFPHSPNLCTLHKIKRTDPALRPVKEGLQPTSSNNLALHPAEKEEHVPQKNPGNLPLKNLKNTTEKWLHSLNCSRWQNLRSYRCKRLEKRQLQKQFFKGRPRFNGRFNRSRRKISDFKRSSRGWFDCKRFISLKECIAKNEYIKK